MKYVCVCVCVRACVRACVCVCVCDEYAFRTLPLYVLIVKVSTTHSAVEITRKPPPPPPPPFHSPNTHTPR